MVKTNAQKQNLSQMGAVVLDTNVFVAAGFNRVSHSARIIEAIRGGHLRLVWDTATRRETKMIIDKIPPLSWPFFAGLFHEDDRFDGLLETARFGHVPDPEDRKFAALAHAARATLVTSDDDLLATRDESLSPLVLTPREFVSAYDEALPDGRDRP